MHVELDHVFICVEPQAPESNRLQRLGLSAQPARRHDGQGTANICYFFQNAYLELIWVENESEATSSVVRATMLWERLNWRQTGACPFGICLRPTRPATEWMQLPFSTWEYRPPYLPDGAFLPVATNSQRLHEPLLFAVAIGPNEPLRRKRPSVNHSCGLEQITCTRLTLPTSELSPELAAIHDTSNIEIVSGDAYRLELSFDDEQADNVEHFSPELPLTIKW